MKLSNANLNSALFQEKNYTLPRYDRAQVLEKTAKTPVWVHMGAGNIARSFVSQIAQDTLDAGKMDTGLIICEGFDYEIIEKAYRPYDNLCINVILNPDGSVRKNVVGSLTESLVMDPAREDWARLKEIFVSPSLQMVSFTITEKGYNLKDLQGNYMPAVLEDFAVGTQAPKTYIGKVAALCYARYQAGALPLALVSMDNCSHNGKRLEDAVCDFAKHWAENGAADAGFAAYIAGNDKIAFPWTAIDKITPRPDPTVCDALTADGLEDMAPVQTARHTFVAPFVNAEQTQYLVVEDHFPNGRPALSANGVYFTDRSTVEKFEQMKVCTCLNPLHTALAVLGCMLGYERISDEMKDADLAELIRRIAFQESMPVVVNPGIIDPVEFARQVIEEHLPNPFIPDTPQRIATDTSRSSPSASATPSAPTRPMQSLTCSRCATSPSCWLPGAGICSPSMTTASRSSRAPTRCSPLCRRMSQALRSEAPARSTRLCSPFSPRRQSSVSICMRSASASVWRRFSRSSLQAPARFAAPCMR